MAKLLVQGNWHTIEIVTDPDDMELVLARCLGEASIVGGFSGCSDEWSERYDTTDDAWQYASSHADGTRSDHGYVPSGT